MALSKIDTNAIADDAVDNTKLDLASNYTFTGEVTADPIKLSPLASVTMSSGQTTTDDAATLIAFDTVDVDTDSAFTNTAGNYKFTVPSGKAGTYMINFMTTSFNENSATQMVQSYIYVNGSTVAYQRQRNDGTNSVTTRHAGTTVHWIGNLSVGDYVQFYYRHDVDSSTPQIQGSQQARATIVRISD